MSQRYIGGLIYNPPGGFSGYFDGSGDNLSLATAAALGSGNTTVEFWFFPTDSSVTYRSVYDSRSSTGTDTGYGIFQYGLTIEVYGNGLKVATAANAFAVNTWVHVALVRNSGTCQLYINGTASGASGTYSNNLTSTVRKIGDSVNNIYPFIGYISNLREVTSAVYTSAFTPPVGPLQAITNTQLLTCAYPTFRDGSSNNFTITVNGNTAVSTQNPFPQTQLPNPALGNQGNGVYSMSQYQALRSQNLWPAIDQYWPYVTLMLHGNGTNGAQNNTFLDSSTNNFTITRNGNTTQGTFTPYGSNWSNYFDGNGDWLSISGAGSSMSLTGNFTIECWLFRQQNPSSLIYQQLFAKASNDFAFKGAAGFGWYLYDGSSYFFTTNDNAVPYNQWSHVAWVRSGSTITMYVNGSSVGSITYASTISYDTTFTLGAGNGAEPYAGYISNFRILKGTALYTSAFTPPTTPLTAITNTSLLTCQSNRFIDNSSNNFTITRNGDVSVQRFSPFNPTTPYAAGTIGGSGYFDGTGDYLTSAVGSGLSLSNTYTIEGWVYNPGNTGGIIFKGVYNTSGLTWTGLRFGVRVLSTTTLRCYFYGTAFADEQTIDSTIPLNSWFHFAMVRNGTTGAVYINGAAAGTISGLNTPGASTQQLDIGVMNITSSLLTFGGYISGLRIVDGTAVYTSAFTPPTAPPTAITNTSLLLNYTNGGIIDNAMMNDLETVGNAQISTSVSKFGSGSLAFDGTGDWLLANTGRIADFGTGDFTIEAWVYLIAHDSDQSTVFAGGIEQSVYNQTNVNINTDGTVNLSGNQPTSNTISLNTWTHLAVSRSSGTSRIFINGVQGSSASNTINYNGIGCFVGVRFGGGIFYGDINGYIDDLRITKGYARYTANFTPQRSQWQDQ